jgi:hypothetical protein
MSRVGVRLSVETEPTAKASIERAVFELSYLTVEAE